MLERDYRAMHSIFLREIPQFEWVLDQTCGAEVAISRTKGASWTHLNRTLINVD